jgi:hypothetical protein
MFLFIGLMLSDYAYATDKWYWQVLAYILSLILSMIDLGITMIPPIFFIGILEHDEDAYQYSCLKYTLYFLKVVVGANVVFYLYSAYFVIQYIIEF